MRDSPSGVAESMRGIIAEQLAAGRTPDEVRSWFVDRYGLWILLSPPSSGLGWMAWLLPGAGVAAGGIAAAMAVRRRGGTRADLGERDLAAVEEALVASEAGTFSPPDTPEGERLEASLLTLSSVRADRTVGLSSTSAEAAAVARAADALAAATARELSAPARQVEASPGRAPLPTTVRWAGLVAAFLLAIIGLLTVTTSPRGSGQLITGNLPQGGDPAQPTDGDAELDRLRAAVLAHPEDGRSRLLLASRLLQSGDDTGARAEIDTVLESRPEDPDGLLLLSLVQARQGDPGAEATLRRFLAVAPPEHPGRDVARGLLDGNQQP